MRVIAGEFRSRKILSPEGVDTRPTSDRLRETLFNILQTSIEGSVFLDAYAGTGAVGIEALSRGARHAIFIEKDKRVVAVIEENLAAMKIAGRAQVIKGSVPQCLAGLDADIVFLDPPYLKDHEYAASMEVLQMKPPPLAVVQHSVRFALRENYGPLRRTRHLKQGENALSFYQRESGVLSTEA